MIDSDAARSSPRSAPIASPHDDDDGAAAVGEADDDDDDDEDGDDSDDDDDAKAEAPYSFLEPTELLLPLCTFAKCANADE